MWMAKIRHYCLHTLMPWFVDTSCQACILKYYFCDFTVYVMQRQSGSRMFHAQNSNPCAYLLIIYLNWCDCLNNNPAQVSFQNGEKIELCVFWYWHRFPYLITILFLMNILNIDGRGFDLLLSPLTSTQGIQSYIWKLKGHQRIYFTHVVFIFCYVADISLPIWIFCDILNCSCQIVVAHCNFQYHADVSGSNYSVFKKLKCLHVCMYREVNLRRELRESRNQVS